MLHFWFCIFHHISLESNKVQSNPLTVFRSQREDIEAIYVQSESWHDKSRIKFKKTFLLINLQK